MATTITESETEIRRIEFRKNRFESRHRKNGYDLGYRSDADDLAYDAAEGRWAA